MTNTHIVAINIEGHEFSRPYESEAIARAVVTWLVKYGRYSSARYLRDGVEVMSNDDVEIEIAPSELPDDDPGLDGVVADVLASERPAQASLLL